MENKPGNESELYEVLTENRHLKDTISAMREQLEAMRLDREESLQRAAATANSEIVQLQAAISTLRDELERMRYEKEQSVQDAISRMDGEARQLKAMAARLRSEMEQQAFACEERIEKERRLHRDELHELHQTINALRESLSTLSASLSVSINAPQAPRRVPR